jgi:hypothetical protein
MPLQFVDSRAKRAAIIATALFALSAGAGARARAQSCHTPSLREPSDTGLRLSFTQLVATFEDEAGDHGEYQGVIATVGWNHPLVHVELALPGYRLVRDAEEIGLGDIAADARFTWVRSSRDELRAGMELAASLPTGDADRELGMGHVMLMPGLWARLTQGPFAFLAQASYGAALGDGRHTQAHSDSPEHQHSAGAVSFPRVNPMNASEFAHALAASYALHPNASVSLRWMGALALDSDGISRQVIAPGLQLMADRLDAALEVQLPLVGDPFDFKLLATIGSEL